MSSNPERLRVDCSDIAVNIMFLIFKAHKYDPKELKKLVKLIKMKILAYLELIDVKVNRSAICPQLRFSEELEGSEA